MENECAPAYRVGHLRADALVAAPESEEGPVQIADEVDVRGPGRAHRSDQVGDDAVEDGQEAGSARLDECLVNDVGLFEANLGKRVGIVIANLDHKRRGHAGSVRCGQAGKRVPGT